MTLFCLLTFVWVSTPMTVAELSSEERGPAIQAGIQSFSILRQSLDATLQNQIETQVFEQVREGELWPAERREFARQGWLRLCDLMLGLQSLEQFHETSMLLSTQEHRAQSFGVRYGAFLLQYRFALDFLDLSADRPHMDIILNEPIPSLGIPEGSYAAFKFKFLNLIIATRFAALDASYKLTLDSGDLPDSLEQAIENDRQRIWEMGQGRGEKLTLDNALKVITRTAEQSWLPIQKGMANVMGDTRVRRQGDALIDVEQIHQVEPQLEVGDILLQRREWYLSNLGIPGFWTHAALYIGSAQQRSTLASDPAVRAWLDEQGSSGMDFDRAVSQANQRSVAFLTQRDAEGHMPKVIEAIAEGVSLTSLEHSAAADSLAVIRPRTTPLVKAQAIWRAIHLVGRPYDYNFDFQSDQALVCSELVYKAYEGHLELPLESLLGRKMLSPNDMARLAALTDESQPLAFVLFLDGSERLDRARLADYDTFAESWKRPKWHIIIE